MKIISVNICKYPDKSGINKIPVRDKIGTWIRDGNTYLDSDFVIDKKHHGGPNRAICCFSIEYYSWWFKNSNDYPFGYVGENLTTEGMTDDSVYLGDVFKIGTMTVQITSNRGPCNVLAKRIHDPDIIKKMRHNSETGYYLRILEAGHLQAGDTVDLLNRADLAHRVSMKDYNRIKYGETTHLEDVKMILANPALASEERLRFERYLLK